METALSGTDRNQASEPDVWAFALTGQIDQKSASAVLGTEGLTPATEAAKADPWNALRWLWNGDNCSLPSVRSCRRTPVPGARIEVAIDETGRGSMQGLRSCGSCHACPVCSGAIWRDREDEALHLVRVAQAEKLHVAMLTLTLRHERTDALGPLLDGCSLGWDAVTKHRAVKEAMQGMTVVGFVRRREVTVGTRNGWHPHEHVLVFVEDADPVQWATLKTAVSDAWRAKAKGLGLRAPSAERGVDLKVFEFSGEHRAEDVVAYYMTKGGTYRGAAAEVADRAGKAAKNGNLTVWELLDEARNGNRWARARWAEYEQATKGRKAWAVSAALRRLANEHVELVAPERTPLAVGQLTEREWNAVCAHSEGPGVLLSAVEDEYRRVRYSGECRDMALLAAALTLDGTLREWGIRPLL